ncbi:hypothetical protein SY88_15375 [Clostridiales bacterium PH28_bin88]|nr:hypothetical protein SY88_15375 [Clostridiales bacterium PH28_bin88]
MEEIANELKFTKASIYYYVPSKENLLYECNDMAMNLLLKKGEPIAKLDLPPDEKMRELIKQHVETLIDEISLITVLLQQEYALNEEHRKLIIEKRDRYEKIFTDVLDEGVSTGVFEEYDPKMVKMIIFGAVNWMFHWYSKSGRLKKKEIGEFFADYLVKPLIKNNQ